MNRREEILTRISAETDRAQNLYSKFNSLHEGYAVMLEELDELWDLIRASKLTAADDRMRDEAVQVAAMAVRFIEDLYEE